MKKLLFSTVKFAIVSILINNQTSAQTNLLCDSSFDSTLNIDQEFPHSGCWINNPYGSANSQISIGGFISSPKSLLLYTGSGNDNLITVDHVNIPILPCTGTVTAGAWIWTPLTQPWIPGSYALVRITFLNSSGDTISSPYDSPLYNVNNVSPNKFEVVISNIPSPATNIKFTIYFYNPNSNGIRAIFVDNCYLYLTSITPQPLSVNIAANPSGSICQGDNVSFTATPVNGGGTLTYQWQVNEANVGTNSSTYSCDTLTDGANVTCILTSNGCVTGSPAISNAITMDVKPNLPASVVISANPVDSICEGTSVTFNATPTNGGTNPSYQWKLNGNDVGTNDSTYTNDSLTYSDTIICILISNATPCLIGSPATSNAIAMTVNPLPTPNLSLYGDTLSCNPSNYQTYQWYYNGNIVWNSAPAIACVGSGNYYVSVTDSSGCFNLSNTINVSVCTVEILENILENNFIIFPNPANDNIIIQSSQKATIEILNIEGQIIKTINKVDIRTTIDLENLPRGVYIIKAKIDKSIVIKRFIKE